MIAMDGLLAEHHITDEGFKGALREFFDLEFSSPMDEMASKECRIAKTRLKQVVVEPRETIV